MMRIVDVASEIFTEVVLEFGSVEFYNVVHREMRLLHKMNYEIGFAGVSCSGHSWYVARHVCWRMRSGGQGRVAKC